jgi:hypothetical protein
MLAREVSLWRRRRSWRKLLLVGGMDEAALDRLKGQGFEITPPNDKALAPPKPFKLSVIAH